MPLSMIAVPVGAVLDLGGSGVYALRTLRGSVRPNPVTWLLWTLAPGVAFAAQLARHVGLPALTTLSVGLGPLLVLLCALTRPGFPGARPNSAELCCAAVPTVVKCHRSPEPEDRTVYALMGVSAVLTLVTLPAWTFGAAGFSCYLLVLCGTLLVLLSRRASRP